MRKGKVVPFESEELKRQTDETIHKLQQGMEKMDCFSIDSPELSWFEQMVVNEQQKMKGQLIKDLGIFFVISLFIISGIIVSLNHMPEIFIILQVAATAFIIFYTSVLTFKRVKMNER